SERINHRYEANNSFSSWEWRAWRVNGGGEYLIQEEPDDLRPASPHGELEYRGSLPLVLSARLVTGQGMNSLEEQDWTNDTRVKTDLESGQPNPGMRRLRLMAEQYQGGDPYGRFYSNKVEHYGIGGISLGF
ncbi:MAG: DUF1207 domain-containing protein, partial [Desulfofustis sp.]|nr:DUF1207 domain-containing protein [Desulfofustis sp.]